MAAHRPFVPFPNPVLKARAAEVPGVDDDIRAVWDEMLAAMYAMPGVGLAAPQLGIGLRLAVVDCSESNVEPVRLANPVLLSVSEETQTVREGSPNLPGIWAEVTRPACVEVGFLDADGVAQERTFEGLWATSVQHQIDHLDGKLFFDRLGPVRRQRLLATWRKGRKAQARRPG